uniref:Uncharacterized protein n=1 Tax=Siphoviridae sp. ctOkv13 TaxID=2826314 RepID=A0A8S5M3G4_9CAUD|nr:MAG TPA: hypothetical protein [Siphoviridae sp. ctOkv13]
MFSFDEWHGLNLYAEYDLLHHRQKLNNNRF